MLRRRDFLITLAAATALGASPALAIGLGSDDRVTTTLNYGPARLDIHAPKNAQGLPVVFYVHGGAWRIGSRRFVQKKPEFFTRNGYVFVSIDYKLSARPDVAEQALDVEAAWRFVRAHVARFGGDPNRMVAMGHSAGSHLVALTGLRGGLPGARGLYLNDIESYDIAAIRMTGVKKAIYGSVFNDPSQWAVLSPITYVAGRQHPPVFIAYSGTPGHQAAARHLADRLVAAGTRVFLYDGSAYNHLEINHRMGAETGGITEATIRYLRKVDNAGA